jgi:hypothetical protein
MPPVAPEAPEAPVAPLAITQKFMSEQMKTAPKMHVCELHMVHVKVACGVQLVALGPHGKGPTASHVRLPPWSLDPQGPLS